MLDPDNSHEIANNAHLLVLVSRTSVMRFLARLTPSSGPPTLMWGSFLLLAPILSLEGQMTQVDVSFPILEKNSAAASPNSTINKSTVSANEVPVIGK